MSPDAPEDVCGGSKRCVPVKQEEGVHFCLHWAVMVVNIPSNYSHIAVQTHSKCNSHFLMNYAQWATTSCTDWPCRSLQQHHRNLRFPLEFPKCSLFQTAPANCECRMHMGCWPAASHPQPSRLDGHGARGDVWLQRQMVHGEEWPGYRDTSDSCLFHCI